MGERTGISWCDSSWNPWRGCTHVSAGCDYCYMFAGMRRFGQEPEKLVKAQSRARDPERWKKGRVVFTCSWSDFFHVDADPWRAEAWEVIRGTPRHTYLILTKRPGRVHRCLPPDWGGGYPNVWLGTSVETQAEMHRVHQIAAIPAAIHFLSAEPLLGPLDLMTAKRGEPAPMDLLDWIVVGGESGPKRRNMDLAWAKDVHRQCQAAGVPFWFKQVSALHSETLDGCPPDLLVRERPALTLVE